MTKPTIAVFSGPKATITNSPPLVTSNKGRTDGDEQLPGRYDHLVPQYLHEPVDVKIRKYTGHPLEADAKDVYHNPEDPYDKVTLDPDDGPYLLPYLSRRDDNTDEGTPFEAADLRDPTMDHGGRQFFYPDASRIFDEIDRTIVGRTPKGTGNSLHSKADYEFVRALPPAGYTQRGEERGKDYFAYEPVRSDPRIRDLAKAANLVQEKLSGSECTGAIWFEGSSRLEETIYWLSLLVDTTAPIVGIVANRKHGEISGDGDRNIVDAVDYIVSGEGEGLGAVVTQDQLVYTAREFKKQDDRPGGFTAVGGHGGIIGSIKDSVRIQYTPTYNHTATSEVALPKLPTTLEYYEYANDDTRTTARIKTNDGQLRGQAIPRVTLFKYAAYSSAYGSDDPDQEVDIMARITQATRERDNTDEYAPDFHGFVFEGTSPYANPSNSQLNALKIAAYLGIPTVRVGRSDPGGFVPQRASDTKPLIVGRNLDANKARMLLIASILKLGPLPQALDPNNPTQEEQDAVAEKLSDYQTIFNTH